jgi:hypothetical protein
MIQMSNHKPIPRHPKQWTPADHVQAEINEKERIIDHWKYKKNVAEMYIKQNREKIQTLLKKKEELQ